MTLYQLIKDNYEVFKKFQRSGIIPASQIAYIESYEYYLELKEQEPKITMTDAADIISQKKYKNKVSKATVFNRIRAIKNYRID